VSGLFGEVTGFSSGVARLASSLAGQASVLPKFDTPVSNDTPPFYLLLRLCLDRSLAAGLGIELVDFAS
jgi:hypothetical protein